MYTTQMRSACYSWVAVCSRKANHNGATVALFGMEMEVTRLDDFADIT